MFYAPPKWVPQKRMSPDSLQSCDMVMSDVVPEEQGRLLSPAADLTAPGW